MKYLQSTFSSPPLFKLSEEINKKYGINYGKKILIAWLFLFSKEDVKDKKSLFRWIERLKINNNELIDVIDEWLK